LKIFTVTETLVAGGAEWFALRLSHALQQQGHLLFVFVLRPDLMDQRLIAKFGDLSIVHLPLWQIKAAVFADRVLNKVFQKSFFVEALNARFLKKKITDFHPDALHSHLIPSDAAVMKANKKTKIPHITTVHGDYIQAVKKNHQRRIFIIQKLIPALDHIAVISEEQVTILKERFRESSGKLKKIYNGYPLPAAMPPAKERTHFTFGMIARGIPEKGWKQAVDAFSKIEDQNFRLHLYGESEYLDRLRTEIKDERIIFGGFTDHPLDVIAGIDVGLLPTYYASESLPTTVIEYLAMGKPVIATNVGEIARMLETDAGIAGIVIKENDPKKMTAPLHEAMMRLADNDACYSKAADCCTEAFKKFSMQRCVNEYLSLYNKQGGQA
jgi:glycosyltransferase involved in cell wall biosynthesis